MTLATDQNLNTDRLSETSRKMLELRETVLREWEKKLRATMKEAATLQHPILINTFPTFYDNVAESLTPDYPRRTGVESTTIASEHGGERARLTCYPPQAIIHEYQVFRWTLIDVLRRHGVALQDGELATLNASVDAAIREAVTAFALIHTALREQFVTALTHDLRGPLAAASMAAELITHIDDAAQIKALAGRIIENHRRMDKMIQDLLDAMVFQGGGRPPMDLSHFDVQEVAHDVIKHFSESHGPRFELTGPSVKGWWVRDALKRALENLIGNALKYGSPDTPVRIKIDSMHGRMLLSVHNEGDPIQPEQLENIFQVFWRALAGKQNKQPGWGIGLPYVRGVAESHGGSAGVDSSVERGTTFYIDVPVDARPFQHAPMLGTPISG